MWCIILWTLLIPPVAQSFHRQMDLLREQHTVPNSSWRNHTGMRLMFAQPPKPLKPPSWHKTRLPCLVLMSWETCTGIPVSSKLLEPAAKKAKQIHNQLLNKWLTLKRHYDKPSYPLQLLPDGQLQPGYFIYCNLSWMKWILFQQCVNPNWKHSPRFTEI